MRQVGQLGDHVPLGIGNGQNVSIDWVSGVADLKLSSNLHIKIQF